MSITTFTVNIPSEGLSASVQLKIVKKAKDIIMFVAGTTDPINITGLKHEANKQYWRDRKHQENLWANIKKLKPQYLDLHIEDEFFSWSGDNNHDARVEAAERLLDLFLRVYSGWVAKDVCLHLIGHSHGGNVINEFTNIIVKDKSFPESWKIKSITYLSTPFFKEQHQLNHTHLHEECMIINVHNEYDITQRFVADFTLKNLEILLENYVKGDFNSATEKIKSVDFEVFQYFKGIVDNKNEGPEIWNNTTIFLDGINEILSVIIKNIECFDDEGILSGQKQEFLARLNEILVWSNNGKRTFTKNKTNRKGGYGLSEFIEDIDATGILRLINGLIDVNKGYEDSYLLSLIEASCIGYLGIVDQIDDTSWTPKKQVDGKYKIEDIAIYQEDTYDLRHKKTNYDSFISRVENCIENKDKNFIKELIMILLSQTIKPSDLNNLLKTMGWLEILVFGDLDSQLKKLKKNFIIYKGLVAQYHADLIAENDLKDEKLKVKPGSIPYLAIQSHSLSHTKLFQGVEDSLKSAFVSGKNSGYKEK